MVAAPNDVRIVGAAGATAVSEAVAAVPSGKPVAVTVLVVSVNVFTLFACTFSETVHEALAASVMLLSEIVGAAKTVFPPQVAPVSVISVVPAGTVLLNAMPVA